MVKSNARTQTEAQTNRLDFHKDTRLQETHKVSSRSLKRLPTDCSSFVESFVGKAHKIRGVKKDGRKQMMAAFPSVKKVDTVAFPGEIQGEIYMCVSIDNRLSGHNEPKRKKPDDVVGSYVAESLESCDSDSDASSVGSCNVMNVAQRRFPIHSAQFLAI